MGGSFNPFHLAHLRLALEVSETLSLDVELIPSAQPPHKAADYMLDFDLRCRLARTGLQSLPKLSLNQLESRRSGPSYTYDTVQIYMEKLPAAQLYFVIGASDFMALPTWHRGKDLLAAINFIIVPRDGIEFAAVDNFIKTALDVDIRPVTVPDPAIGAAWRRRAGNAFLYLPITRLGISSSIIRQAWRLERSLKGLVPEAVEQQLLQNRALVDQTWKMRKLPCGNKI